MASLYDLTSYWLNIYSLEGAESDDDLKTALDSIEVCIEEKMLNIGYVIKNLEADEKALEDEEKRLKAKRDASKKRIESLKDYVFRSMNAMEKKEIDTTLFKFKIQKNPPKVVVDEENVVGEKYYDTVIETKLNKKRLKEDLDNGIELPYARLVQGESLRIK